MVYKNRIAMAPTLQAVLSAVFLQKPEPAAPILRELEEETRGAADPLPGLLNLDTPSGAPANEGELSQPSPP
jgi:hypothetical protein